MADARRLTQVEAEERMRSLDGWKLVSGGTSMEKKLTFDDFAAAIAFVNAVGALAEEANHHPDIEFGWGRAKIILSTHSLGGISEKDIELARKIDDLAR